MASNRSRSYHSENRMRDIISSTRLRVYKTT
jgi:hypothetical protein